MRHANGATRVSGQEGGVQRNTPNGSTRDVESCQSGPVNTVERRRPREHAFPYPLPLDCIRKRKANDESQAAQKRSIQRILAVRGQDRETGVRLQALQQIAHLDVGISIVAVLDVGSLAEER